MRSRDRRRHRPKAEKEDNNSENHCPSIDDNIEDTRKTEWSPDKLISLACVVGDVCRLSDSTGASTPEEKALRDDVRSVETAYAKGDDIVESGGRADTNETDEAGDKRRYDDCEEWDCGLRLDLRGNVHQEPSAIRRSSQRTLLTDRHPGRPRSRAKAQTKRDAVATSAIVPATSMMIMMAIGTEAPALEPVAS